MQHIYYDSRLSSVGDSIRNLKSQDDEGRDSDYVSTTGRSMVWFQNVNQCIWTFYNKYLVQRLGKITSDVHPNNLSNDSVI